ncbi:hypothetical protein [Acinetobacter radioresistens]|uniref:hypothetical protein n=1 Tax=Acinetobacter radioresistens TaxID=40216 RepID=UPI0020039255|nr:hypothetical protein [Acinetobacter radioresistens]MCK4090671.1 hypothetical protein [Acinetobacter radioresistens]MCK4108900.1 hypothetical protein [Acinetobacter radioresistens]
MQNEYRIAIRKLLETSKRRGQQYNLRHYQIQTDELNDPSLVSLRLYGSRKYVDVVLVACGLSYAHELLPLQAFYFPTLQNILQLQKKHEVV